MIEVKNVVRFTQPNSVELLQGILLLESEDERIKESASEFRAHNREL